MAGFTIEGEIESLTPRQIEFIGDVLQKRGLKHNKVHIEQLGKAGDNYAANVKKIITELNNGETFKMIAKVAPTNETLRTRMSTVLVFENECFMYNEVLPKFTGLQQAVGLSKEDLFRYPECYGTLMEPFHEIILLEDLKESNFEMLDRFTPLTNENVKVILNKFAIIHSLSFVLKRQEPEVFKIYSEKLQDMFANAETEEFSYHLKNIETGMIAMMDSDKYKKPIFGSISKLFEHPLEIINDENSLRHFVVVHGDGWTNNVMFRLEENVPVDAVLIDYQMSKVENPVGDLHYMIFGCTDYTTRQQHYYEWIDFYHSELDKSLANFGMKVNDVYPRDQLDSDLKRYSKMYFATAIFMITTLIRSPEDASKMKELLEKEDGLDELEGAIPTSSSDPGSVDLFKTKIEHLIDSFYEFGYFDT